ncbi:MAG: DUF6101 family protein [Rhodoblastus sp.]|uniref:DUF6101 family protein n=1 Tax=Rhodoblastus sp. TaxID=1962975 RepID=UPI003F9BABD7
MTHQAEATANLIARDPRADGGQRQISIAADAIAIDRRVAGVRMRLALPIRAFRGVSLAMVENAHGCFYRVTLDHRDPDLTVTLAEARSENEIAPEWKAWAQFFQLPRLTLGLDQKMTVLDRSLGELALGAVQPRKRGWPLKQRRSKISAFRKAGPNGRVMAVFREREIVCYE